MDILEQALPRGWPKRVLRTLATAGVYTYADLMLCDQLTLLRLPQFGRSCLDFVNDELAKVELLLPVKSSTHAQREMVRATVEARTQESAGVYFLKCQHLVKIGYGGLVQRRISSVKSGIPFDVETLAIVRCNLPAAWKLEQQLHQQFHDLHYKGEWFHYESPLVEHIASLAPHD
jgi:hypothetical protein